MCNGHYYVQRFFFFKRESDTNEPRMKTRINLGPVFGIRNYTIPCENAGLDYSCNPFSNACRLCLKIEKTQIKKKRT